MTTIKGKQSFDLFQFQSEMTHSGERKHTPNDEAHDHNLKNDFAMICKKI